jgi:hypothetical protein
MLKRRDIIKENKFYLTPEQRVALIENKIRRAEHNIRAMAEMLKARDKSK